MIFNFPILKEYEAPCVPYPTAYLEGMHKWYSRERFAWLPRRLYEYEERSSIMFGGLGPDEYRWFYKTTKMIWLEKYVEIETYHRHEARMPPPYQSKHLAVDPYFVMISSM
jgi:hypothetical protein